MWRAKVKIEISLCGFVFGGIKIKNGGMENDFGGMENEKPSLYIVEVETAGFYAVFMLPIRVHLRQVRLHRSL